MKTSVLVAAVVVAALAIAAYADDKCSKITRTCPDDGSHCVGDFFTNGTEVCNHVSKCCAYPLYCIEGKCREDSRKRDCKEDKDCLPAFYGTGVISCVDSKCVIQGSFNDSCTKDEHCAGDQKCSKDKCAGLKEGHNCTNRGFQCGFNGTCVNGKCKAVVPLDGKCKNTTECDVYSVCSDGVCVNRFSVKEGGSCDPYTDNDEACGKGLYCYKPEGKCRKAVKHRYIKCSNDTDCQEYGNTSECKMCDAVEGHMYCSEPENVARDCISELTSAYKCYRKHGCAPKPSSSLDTCAQTECTAETNAVFACRTWCDQKKDNVGKKCVADITLRYCPLIPTWLRIVIAFSILIVIILVVFTFYGFYNCCCKKKKKKDGYAPVGDSSSN